MNEMMFQIYPLVCVENIPGKREDEKTNKSGKNIAFFVHRSSLIKTNIDSNKHFPSTYFQIQKSNLHQLIHPQLPANGGKQQRCWIR
jgi:hypothetical protein